MAQVLRIHGGARLEGTVAVGGGKNAAVAIIPAALLADSPSVIENLPDIEDVHVLIQMLRWLGAEVEFIGGVMTIDPRGVDKSNPPYELASKMRASYYLSPVLLGVFGHSAVPMPGGCDIGARPIDQTIKGMTTLGAKVDTLGGVINASADRLYGADIFLDMPSVGATVNSMLTAVSAEGYTQIHNAAKEPHVVDVANFLNSMGANIRGAGTDVIRIRGVKRLHGTEYSIIPDQIEAGTFMCAAAVTRGDITIQNVIPKHLESITAKLIELGCEVTEFDEAIRVVGRPHQNHMNIKTLPYPGFPTDMQPQITVTLALAEGTSIVTESIFENRFKYVDELSRMGGNIHVEGNTAIIVGVNKLMGAEVVAPDLRAGAALVLAGLAADGYTVVDEIGYIRRGYESFEEKLRGLGACIEAVESEREAQKFRLRIG